MKKQIIIWLIVILIGFANAHSPISYFKIDHDKCIGCGKCVIHCPVDAIELIDGKAVIDADKCIKCGMCYKICPIDAIDPVYQSDTTTTRVDSVGTDSPTGKNPSIGPVTTNSCYGCTQICPANTIQIDDIKDIDLIKCLLYGNSILNCPSQIIIRSSAEKDS